MPLTGAPDNAVFAIQGDLREETELRRIVEVTLARFGRIDFLVNAAAFTFLAPILEGDGLHKNFHQQLEVNLFVPLRLSTLVAEKFWKNRELENRQVNRSIVNISSTSGLYIYPDLGQSVYSASKAALNYLKLHMAEEFRAIGVRANVLAANELSRFNPNRVRGRRHPKTLRERRQRENSGSQRPGRELVVGKDERFLSLPTHATFPSANGCVTCPLCGRSALTLKTKGLNSSSYKQRCNGCPWSQPTCSRRRTCQPGLRRRRRSDAEGEPAERRLCASPTSGYWRSGICWSCSVCCLVVSPTGICGYNSQSSPGKSPITSHRAK
jgi:NAD(P)-dependent dehydrogenase (short-subunit alcohol dehydrogenase family)